MRRVFPIDGGKEWELGDGLADALKATYRSADVDYELEKAYLWLKVNPERLKTARGMPRFLNTWLGRADERAREEKRRGSGSRDRSPSSCGNLAKPRGGQDYDD